MQQKRCMTNGFQVGVIGLLSWALWLLLLAKLFLCIMISHVYHRCYGIQWGRALPSPIKLWDSGTPKLMAVERETQKQREGFR
jgi:hypothetical protein